MAIVLENESLRAEFNERTGTLVSLTAKASGWNLVRRRELGLSFRMHVPIPDRRKHYVIGEQQSLVRWQLSPDGETLTLIWKDLVSQHAGTLDITFTGTARLDDSGLHFTGTVENDSQYTVEAVAWPCVGDIRQSGKGSSLYRLNPLFYSAQKLPLLPEHQGDKGYWGTDIPTSSIIGSPFMLLEEDSARGWYVGVHDVQQREFVAHFFEVHPGYLDSHTRQFPREEEISGHVVKVQMLEVHFCYASPGETVELSPIVLQPYDGDWTAGADIYKGWRATWFARPRMPEWVKDVHSWLQLQINGSEDDLRYRYSDLPAIAKECNDYGIGAIQLVGWNKGGQDRGNPLHDTDPRLGTAEELRSAIQQCHEIGVRIILFTKFTWADRSQDWYREGGFKHAITDPYGDPYPGAAYQYQTWAQLLDINTRRLVPMCHASPDWRAAAADEFKKVVALAPAGMLYDECQHHGIARYCFDKTHNHRCPAYVYAYDNRLIEEFKKLSEPTNPDFMYGGEALYDLENLQYHLSYARMDVRSTPHHFQRYIDPMAQMMMAVKAFDDRNQLNKCLQHRYIISYEPFNFKGLPHDAPLTLAYGAKVDAFRRRFRDYLWDSEYREKRGATVTVGGKSFTDYSVFHQACGKRAVVVTNMDAEKAIRATVALDGGAKGRLVTATPEKPARRGSSGRFTIPPRSVVVLMEV